MTIKEILFLCSMFFVAKIQAQSTNQVLQEIEKNNAELKTFQPYKESQIAALEATNVLPNPELGTYYLPLGSKGTKNHWEIDVSQSFKMPKVYKARKEFIQKQGQVIDYEYQEKRQEILLEAKLQLQKIIAANKLQKIEQNRLANAQKLLNQNQILFDKGEMSILELNKSKVAFLKAQFKVKNVQVEKENAELNLTNLNNNESISVSRENFESNFSLPNKETLWQERLKESSRLKRYQYLEKMAQEQINFVNYENLPDFKVGYAVQGLLKENTQGIFLGTSIPVWSKKARKKAADAKLVLEKKKTEAQHVLLQNEFDVQYNEYQALLNKYNDYAQTLESLNSEYLLLKAYRAGEISFSEYFLELEFYHNAHDAMLAMEKELHLLKSKLLNHKL